MRYWIAFLIAGVILVGLVTFLLSDRVSDTLIAMAVFVAISSVVREPLERRSSDRQ